MVVIVPPLSRGGSLEFNEAYVTLYLERRSTSRQVIPLALLPAPDGQPSATQVEWDTCRWQVKRLSDLLAMAGLWVTLLVADRLARTRRHAALWRP